MEAPVIIFPHLGITIQNLTSGFDIGGFHIAFYGILIAVGMILAVVISMLRAKKTNQFTDNYIDIGIISIIASIIGARIYYVMFSLDEYTDIAEIFNVRQGGLAVYGGIIAGVLATYFVCCYKKISFLRVLDTAVPGIVLAQAIGRWGNFFNMEAYGGYTDSLFAMQIKYSEAGGTVSRELLRHLATVDETQYIQVHPTFLYESAWCLLLFVLLMIFSRFQRYSGEVLLWYVGGYALERAFVEGLRTDQLVIGNTGIAVSQILSIGLLAAAFVILLINRIRLATHTWDPEFRLVLEDGDPGTKDYYEELKNQRKKSKKAGKGSQWETYTVGTEDASLPESGSSVADEDFPGEAEDTAENLPGEAEDTAGDFPEERKVTAGDLPGGDGDTGDEAK